MILLPFICLGLGAVLGFQNLKEWMIKSIDHLITGVLVVLMLTIGTNIGVNDAIMSKLHVIGLNCLIIAVSSIVFSVLLVLLVEKTVLPLDKLKQLLTASHVNLNNEVAPAENNEKAFSPLVFIMPLSILSGVALGYYVVPKDKIFLLGYILTGTLIFLYIGVGISLGHNRRVFRYIRLIGPRIIYLSLAIFAGSLMGGYVAGLILGLSPETAVISASGMCYYSLTGAFMTEQYGIEIGTYGFVVNVMREFLTVLLLPLLIRISKGSTIASGAAGNMDTMLMPITKFVGPELGLVTLITGTILTFAVPVVLPILSSLL